MPLYRTLFLSVFAFTLLACSGPEAIINSDETAAGSTDEVTVNSDEQSSDKQSAVTEAANAAGDAGSDAADSENATADNSESVNESVTEKIGSEETNSEGTVAEAEAATLPVDWLTITERAEFERAAIGNPEAPLVITEFSDFM